MDEGNVRHLLTQLKIPHQKAKYTGSFKGGKWMTISCPFAPWTHAKHTDLNPGFGITIKDAARSNYKCLSCGMKGRLAALPSILGGYRKQDYSKLRQWAETAEFDALVNRPLPKWNDPLAIDSNERRSTSRPDPAVIGHYPYAIGSQYLHKRGIGLFDVLRMGIRWDAYQRRILFPVYDPDGVFCGFTGRANHDQEWTKEYPKVRDYHGLNKREIFLGLRGKQPGKKIIVEGLFDYAKLVHFGYHNTRAILGTAMTPEKLEILIDEGEPVYLFLDNDLPGWQAMFGTFDPDENLKTENSWAFNLYRHVPVWIVPYRENLAGGDPGSIDDKQALDAQLKRAWLFTGVAPTLGPGRASTLRPKRTNIRDF
jgi:hypothetical protein